MSFSIMKNPADSLLARRLGRRAQERAAAEDALRYAAKPDSDDEVETLSPDDFFDAVLADLQQSATPLAQFKLRQKTFRALDAL